VTYATITTCPVIRIYSSSSSTWTTTSLTTSSITLTSCVAGCSAAGSLLNIFSSDTSYDRTEIPTPATPPTNSSSSLMTAPSSSPSTFTSTSSLSIVTMPSSFAQTPSSKIAGVGPRSMSLSHLVNPPVRSQPPRLEPLRSTLLPGSASQTSNKV